MALAKMHKYDVGFALNKTLVGTCTQLEVAHFTLHYIY